MDVDTSNGKHFKCDKCSYSCKLPQNLLTHLRTHRKGQALLYCNMCSYVASNKLQLARHRNSECLKKLTLASKKTTMLEKNNNEPKSLLRSKSSNDVAPRIVKINGKLAQVELVHFDATSISEAEKTPNIASTNDNERDPKKVDMINNNYHLQKGPDAVGTSHAEKTSNAAGSSGNEDNETMPEIDDFQCSYCSKSYACLDSLDIHMMNHKRSKTFNCLKCPYRGNQPGGLWSHLKIHSGGILFPCDECEFESSSAKTLTRHRNQFHDVMNTIGKSSVGRIRKKPSSTLVTLQKLKEQKSAAGSGAKKPVTIAPKPPVPEIPKNITTGLKLPFVSVEKLPMSSISKIIGGATKPSFNISKAPDASMPPTTSKISAASTLSTTSELPTTTKVSTAPKFYGTKNAATASALPTKSVQQPTLLLPTTSIQKPTPAVSTTSIVQSMLTSPSYFQISMRASAPTTTNTSTVPASSILPATSLNESEQQELQNGKLASVGPSDPSSIPQEPPSLTKRPKPALKLVFSCPYCVKVFPNRRNLEVHIRLHTGEKPFQCNQCNYSCTQKSKLQTHVKLHRMGMKAIKCSICSYISGSTFGMNAHHRKQHLESTPKPTQVPSAIPVSNEETPANTVESEDQNTAVGIDQNVRNILETPKPKQNSASEVEELPLDVVCKVEAESGGPPEVTPEANTTEERNNRSVMYRCELCSYFNKFQFGLNRHMVRVHKVKDLQPNVPLKQEISVENFHKNFAEDEPEDQESDVDPLAINEAPQQEPPERVTQILLCPLCQQTFPREFLLDIHMRTHMQNPSPKTPIRSQSNETEKRPSSASEEEIPSTTLTINNVRCLNDKDVEASFARPIKPVQSPTIPVGSRRFHCPYCNKNLGSNQSLEIHVRIHTGEKPYHCSLCSYSTNQQINLKTHMRSHRNGVVYKCKNCDFTSSNVMAVNVHNSNEHGETNPTKKVKCKHAPNPIPSTPLNGWSMTFGIQADSNNPTPTNVEDEEWVSPVIHEMRQQKQNTRPQAQPNQMTQQQTQTKQIVHQQQQQIVQQAQPKQIVQQQQQQIVQQQQQQIIQQAQPKKVVQQQQQQIFHIQLAQPRQIAPQQQQQAKPKQIVQQQQQQVIQQQSQPNQIAQQQQQTLQFPQQYQILQLPLAQVQQLQHLVQVQQLQQQKQLQQFQQQNQVQQLQQQKQVQQLQQQKQVQQLQQQKQVQQLQQQKQVKQLQQQKHAQQLLQKQQSHQLQQQKLADQLHQQKLVDQLLQQKLADQLQQQKQVQQLQHQKQADQLQQQKLAQQMQQQKLATELQLQQQKRFHIHQLQQRKIFQPQMQQHTQTNQLHQQPTKINQLQQQTTINQLHKQPQMNQLQQQSKFHQLQQHRQAHRLQQQRHLLQLKQVHKRLTNPPASFSQLQQINVQPEIMTPQFSQSNSSSPDPPQARPGIFKPFACTYCGRRFRQRNQLVNHTRIHTGEKPYKCNECDYATSHQQSLIIHSRRHTGERPYSCNVCGHTTASLPALYIHRKRHAKPFKCNFCPRESCDKSVIDRHELRHFTTEQE